MPLGAGEKLGPYEILAGVGAGGMGEVYRARDLRLKRDVALKVLPEVFARDPDRMARFQREAEVLASLNHSNIAHIYGVEERALVMEFVEGESPKGPLPFNEAWKICIQIADALEYAHERGIVHRDLKPANVKVTPEGVVKLLDFGLAKAFDPTPDAELAGADVGNSPTVTLGATVAGTIMGTAAYMAPEQTKGKRVDKRADIWSWGVVLYELLTGERLFKGEDVADTLAQVLTKEPDVTRVPRQVRKLLGRCLEKDPKKRLRDIGEARYLLEESGTDSHAQAKGGSKMWQVVTAVLAVIAAVLTFVHFREAPPALPFMNINFDLGPDAVLGLGGAIPALSPDGSSLVYQSRTKNGTTQLSMRRLDHAKATELADTGGGIGPFFSPDGKWLGFLAFGGALKKCPYRAGVL
jgi:serine/threonine-protein kinase